MRIHRGIDKENAIKIKYNIKNPTLFDQMVEHYLDELFGMNDGAYFIQSSQERTDSTNRKFRILYIEDKDTIKHQVFFEHCPIS